MTNLRRPALRYYGAKWKLAPWIIGHFGAHEVYVEPFGGSAAVLLRKERSLIEVYNDLDLEVVNFFYVLREFAERLEEAAALTPFALAEFEWSQAAAESCLSFLSEVFAPGRPFDWAPDEQAAARMIEAARLFYVRSYLGMTGPTTTGMRGFRRQKVFSRGKNGAKKMTAAAVTFGQTSHLRTLAERLRGVIIDNLQALDCIRKYDGRTTLFYVDPPYVQGTRVRWAQGGYRHEMSDEEHKVLLEMLAGLEGQVVVSGYASELYDGVLSGWTRQVRKARINGSGSAVEVLWLNEAAVEARKGYGSLPLFREA